MDNEFVEFTTEGYEKVIESLDFLPENQRKEMMDNMIEALMMPV